MNRSMMRSPRGHLTSTKPLVTIRDVATRAGVSTGTVSNVLNNNSSTHPELYNRVNKAIRELNYQPHELARGLRTGQTKTVGIIIPNIVDPFFPLVVRGAEDALFRQGYALIVGNSDGDLNKEESYFKTFYAKKVDGILLIVAPSDRLPRHLLDLDPQKLPLVQIGRVQPEVQGDSVMLDDVGGSYQGVRHLLEFGHRRIAILTGPLRLLDARRRLQGYEMALGEHGIPPEPSLIREGRYDIESGYTQAKALLGLDPRPTAIFSCNHLMSAGAVRALTEMGLYHPPSIALVSFDELDWFDLLRPSISAVRQPTYDLGSVGAELLVRRMKGEVSRPFRRTILQGELVVRESSNWRAGVP